MFELNRVYWKYRGSNSFMRPKFYEGVGVTCPKYVNKGVNIKEDMIKLVTNFHQKYKNDFSYVIALSGGIDSELVAETFYQLKIPFRAISLSLFNNKNFYDLIYAREYTAKRKIAHLFMPLSLKKFTQQVIPKAVELGQFSESLSQAALTYLFNYIMDDEILIFSGHNPDYNQDIGFGWSEDSPNLVKYAINNKNNFFTFTSLEPIFLHYKANYSLNEPGHKNNNFIYKCYPKLRQRMKRTGWETSLDIQYGYSKLLSTPLTKDTGEIISVFIGWKDNDYFT